ncbi:hypothetical protein BGZ76_008097, partial [Entomortierella beljakovae]
NNLDPTHPENSNILEIFFKLIMEDVIMEEVIADALKCVYGSNHIVKEINLLAAESGSSSAQSSIGEMYLNGCYVEQNYTKAMEWLRKAASQSDAKALFNIGRMYEYGYGVPQDYSTAVVWYTRASHQDYTEARFK